MLDEASKGANSIQLRLEKERTNQEMIAHQARPCELHDFIEKLEKP